MSSIYGAVHDPDGDCQFGMRGEALRVTVPPDPHVFAGSVAAATDNAPCVWRDVEGDFTVSVRVSVPVWEAPGPEPSGGERYIPYATAGLVVHAAKLHGLRLVWKQRATEEGVREGFYCELNRPVRYDGPNWFDKDETGPAYLRIARTGNAVSFGWSRDGKAWTDREAEVDWGRRVKVGVLAENTARAPLTATFDRYTLVQPKK